MKNVINAIAVLKQINSEHNLSCKKLIELNQNAANAKVCMPVIGKFSSGKSSLLNAILGYSRPFLKVDITPETAVPTEIEYVAVEEEQPVTVQFKDGTHKKYTIRDYRSANFDAASMETVHLRLHCTGLAQFPDILLVDLPGFESGYAAHDMAINNYVDKSLAYLFTVSADDMILRSSMIKALREIGIYDVPIAVVVTKRAKGNDSFETDLKFFNQKLEHHLGLKAFHCCITDSSEGDVEQLRHYLAEIQSQAQNLLKKKFSKLFLDELQVTQRYLQTLIQGKTLEESEIAAQKDALARQSENTMHKLMQLSTQFDEESNGCVEAILGDVKSALDGQCESYASIAMEGQDPSDAIRSTVREAVTRSVKDRFISVVQKYTNQVQQTMISENFPVSSNMSVDIESSKALIVGAVVSLFGGFGGILVSGLLMLINKFHTDKKREQAHNALVSRLQSEVFPQILSSIQQDLGKTISQQTAQVKNTIRENINQEQESQRNALTELKRQQREEAKDKQAFLDNVQKDLDVIEELKHSLQL